MNELQRVRNLSLDHNGDESQATDDMNTVKFAHDRIMEIINSNDDSKNKSMQVYSILADMFEDVQ